VEEARPGPPEGRVQRCQGLSCDEIGHVTLGRLARAFPRLLDLSITRGQQGAFCSVDEASALGAFFGSDLQAASRLVSLTLEARACFAVVAVLALSCPSLQSLSVSQADAGALRALASGLTSVTSLALDQQDCYWSGEQAAALGSLTRLRSLSLQARVTALHLRGLAPLTQLSALSVSLALHWSDTTGLQPLAQLQQLRQLCIASIVDVESSFDSLHVLQQLTGLQQLTSLRITQADASDEGALAHLTALQELSAGMLKPRELLAALALPHLTSLCMDGSSLDGPPLQELQRAAAACQIQDLCLTTFAEPMGLNLAALSFSQLGTFANITSQHSEHMALLPRAPGLRCALLLPGNSVAMAQLAASFRLYQRLQVLALAPIGKDVMQAVAGLPQLKALALGGAEQGVGPLDLVPLATSTSLKELVLLGLRGIDKAAIATLALAPALEELRLGWVPADGAPCMSQEECEEAVAAVMQQRRVLVQVGEFAVEGHRGGDCAAVLVEWLEDAGRRWVQ
jgi:hypothetical protein